MQWEASEIQVASRWCIENSVCYKSFITWRKRLQDGPHNKNHVSDGFVELKDSDKPHSGIKIHRQNLTVTLNKNFDEASLFRCLQVLRQI